MEPTITNTNTQAQDRLFFRIAIILSVVVALLVVVLNRKVIPRPDVTPDFIYFLPKLNALLNGTCSVLLLISLYFIKQRKIDAHKNTNIVTFFLSTLFLLSYVLFHYFVDDTTFPSDNPLKPLYLTILIPHIILAALVLPLILLSFYHGLKMNVSKHKKLVRFAYPIWLFVTVSGVVVYLMISPYYKF
jgi:putative membrane protein